MKFDGEKRVFMVEKMIEMKSGTLVQRSWRQNFKGLPVPTLQTIQYNYKKFKNQGSVRYVRSENSKKPVKREEAKKTLEEMFTENCSLSIRKAASASNISIGLVHTILRKDLDLKPYKIYEYHKLEKGDDLKRVEFAKWFLENVERVQIWFICSDEAYFYLTPHYNKQNTRRWLKTKPLDGIEQPLHDENVLVWCAFSAVKVYGPFFFESTVNQYNYLEMLQKYFWPKHRKVKDYQKFYFQQDGATPHTANMVQNWLSEKFGERFLAKSMWPPRSPDLNPCDYFLWGYLKSLVYNPLPRSIDDLKENITREVKKIDKNILNDVFSNLQKRCEKVIQVNGTHIDNK